MTLKKRSSRVAESVAAEIVAQCEKEKVKHKDVVALIVKHLKLQDEILVKPDTRDGSLTKLGTRQIVWDFYHEQAQESTNTTALAKMLITKKPRVQDGLVFKSIVHEVTDKRKRRFYQSIWWTLLKTFRELHKAYNTANPLNTVSIGTFYALKPFYMRHASSKDLVMCCCKIHLHIRWAIQALVKCIKKEQQQHDLMQKQIAAQEKEQSKEKEPLLQRQKVEFPVDTYDEFFQYLYSECEEGERTYLPWACTPDKDDICSSISSQWSTLQTLILKCDERVTVQFTQYEKKECFDKQGNPLLNAKGEQVKRLKPVQQQVNARYLMEFIDNILPAAVHHRNHLKYYRNTIHTFRQLFECVSMDIDFSENLTLEVKFEPQSLHWYKVQITVHSGLLKIDTHKSYHPYLSDSKVHDQAFVKLVILKMLSTVEDMMSEDTKILIESDNCSSQYKSTEHFADLQDLANQYQRTVIRVYGIAGHGKGEVDHVGGVGKVVYETQ